MSEQKYYCDYCKRELSFEEIKAHNEAGLSYSGNYICPDCWIKI